MSEHSPLPWKVFPDDPECVRDPWNSVLVYSAKTMVDTSVGKRPGREVVFGGKTCDYTHPTKENVLFIARAVNAHEALVEALEDCLVVVDNYLPGCHAWKLGRAALAKAKGKR